MDSVRSPDGWRRRGACRLFAGLVRIGGGAQGTGLVSVSYDRMRGARGARFHVFILTAWTVRVTIADPAVQDALSSATAARVRDKLLLVIV